MIPDEALALVKRFEGLHKLRSDGLVHAYVCPAGVWTVGWGSTRLFDGTPVSKETTVTPEEAEALLIVELGECVRAALRMSPVLQGHPARLSAIASFIYNLGSGRYKASTLRRRINQENWEEARREIKRWVWGGGRKLPGLVIRREAEAALL